jgi:hypothetical protein
MEDTIVGMRRRALLVLAFGSLACKPSGAAAPPASGDSAQQTDPPPASPKAAPSDAFGIPVCDRYVADMHTCIDGTPEDAQPQLREALASATTSWQEAIANGNKAAVIDACYDARDEGEEILGEMGCSFAHVDDPPRSKEPASSPQKKEFVLTVIGVPECDEYIRAYVRCIDEKVPESSRGSMVDAMNVTVKAWSDAAKTNPTGLAEACSNAMEAARHATKQMGCTWPELH